MVQLKGSLALVGYDGTAANLVAFRGDQQVLIARGVPPGGVLLEPEGTAVLTDYDGEAGTLLASEGDLTELELIAERVHPRSYRFMLNMGAVGYVRDHDPDLGGGTLGVRVLETRDRFEVPGPVAEWDEVAWPSVGLLYVVEAGPRAGVWFAKAK